MLSDGSRCQTNQRLVRWYQKQSGTDGDMGTAVVEPKTCGFWQSPRHDKGMPAARHSALEIRSKKRGLIPGWLVCSIIALASHQSQEAMPDDKYPQFDVPNSLPTFVTLEAVRSLLAGVYLHSPWGGRIELLKTQRHISKLRLHSCHEEVIRIVKAGDMWLIDPYQWTLSVHLE